MTGQLLRIEDVIQRTTLARTTIYKLMNEGKFPRNGKIGQTAVWSEKEVCEFIETIMRQRGQK